MVLGCTQPLNSFTQYQRIWWKASYFVLPLRKFWQEHHICLLALDWSLAIENTIAVIMKIHTNIWNNSSCKRKHQYKLEIAVLCYIVSKCCNIPCCPITSCMLCVLSFLGTPWPPFSTCFSEWVLLLPTCSVTGSATALLPVLSLFSSFCPLTFGLSR